MIYTTMIKKAMNIAYEAHKEQLDRSGVPYIFHPLHLAEQMETEEAVIVALLHDVAEDTAKSINDLALEGFSKEIINALELLTHLDDMDYIEYVGNIKASSNQTAIAVKLADLRHNSDLSRLDEIEQEAIERIEKYAKAIRILEG